VPLPASEWPPGYYHRWYVEVSDGVKDNLTAQIEEITLTLVSIFQPTKAYLT
jgi:hypothetical protein